MIKNSITYVAIFTSCSLLLTACGGGSDTASSNASNPAASVKNYKQQIMGLIQGSYSLSCQDALGLTPATDATLSINDSGDVALSGQATVNFSDVASVFSIAASYVQDPVINNVLPGVAVLGKSGDISIGVNFKQVIDNQRYEMAQFFFQNEKLKTVQSCTPKGSQKMANQWGSVALITAMTNGGTGTVKCGSESTSFSLSGGILKLGSSSFDFRGSKIKELYQTPVDQVNPTVSNEDNFRYTATLLNGDTVDFTKNSLTGISTIKLTKASTGIPTTISCSK